MLELASRACASVTTRAPVPGLTQKVVRLSETGAFSTLLTSSYCVSSVASRRPKPPVWAAAAATADEPVPCALFQLPIPPDSKPSAKTVFVYCESAALGVIGPDGADSGPLPTLLIAETVKV